MSVDIIVAVIAGAVALLSAFLSVLATQRTKRLEETQRIRSEQRSREERAKEIVARYREPLARSAYELQSRLYNAVTGQVFTVFIRLGERERNYVVNHTMYVLAEFLAWEEIIRREIQFLDLGATDETKRLTDLLADISTCLLTDNPRVPPYMRLYSGEQRAIGEVMMTALPDGRHDCIGYAEFVGRLSDPSFQVWFGPVQRDIESLAGANVDAYERIITLQRLLINLIDYLDNPPKRFPANRRKRLAVT